METDQAIISLVLQGQQEKYKLLIDKYQKLVYYTVFKMIHQKEEAEDVTQEVFIQAYRSLSYFRFDSSFSSWLLKIAVNKTIDRKRKKQVPTLPQTDRLAQLASQSKTPLDTLLHREDKSLLNKKIFQLPDIYQRAIHDYYYQEMSYQEIALKEGVEIKTIETRLYRARYLLKQLWKEESSS